MKYGMEQPEDGTSKLGGPCENGKIFDADWGREGRDGCETRELNGPRKREPEPPASPFTRGYPFCRKCWQPQRELLTMLKLVHSKLSTQLGRYLRVTIVTLLRRLQLACLSTSSIDDFPRRPENVLFSSLFFLLRKAFPFPPSSMLAFFYASPDVRVYLKVFHTQSSTDMSVGDSARMLISLFQLNNFLTTRDGSFFMLSCRISRFL